MLRVKRTKMGLDIKLIPSPFLENDLCYSGLDNKLTFNDWVCES